MAIQPIYLRSAAALGTRDVDRRLSTSLLEHRGTIVLSESQVEDRLGRKRALDLRIHLTHVRIDIRRESVRLEECAGDRESCHRIRIGIGTRCPSDLG